MAEGYAEYDDHPNATYEVTAIITIRVQCPRALVEDPVRQAYWTPSKSPGDFVWYIGDMVLNNGHGHIEGLTEAESRIVSAECLDVEVDEWREVPAKP